MLLYSNAHWHVRPKGEAGGKQASTKPVTGGKELPLQEQCIHTHANDRARHPQFFKTRHFLQALPSYSCWPAIIHLYIYNICIYLYNLLLRKSGWNSFRTLAHVRTKAHFLVRAFTGLLYIHSDEALSHHGWLLRQRDRKKALLFRWSKECLCALFSFPAFFYLRTKRHNKITLHFFGTFSCSFKQEGKVAAAETKHRRWEKKKKKRSERKANDTPRQPLSPTLFWTVSRPDPKVQHLSSTKWCCTTFQLFAPLKAKYTVVLLPTRLTSNCQQKAVCLVTKGPW